MRIWILAFIMMSLASCAPQKRTSPPPSAAAVTAQKTIVVLRVVDEATPASQPATAQGVQPVLTVEARPNQHFAGTTQVLDDTIKVDGTLQSLPNGRYRLVVRYRRTSPMGLRAFDSTVELGRGEDFPLGGAASGPGEEVVILRLQ